MLLKRTKTSIDNKIAKMTDDNHYNWYQNFHNEADGSPRNEIIDYYIEKAQLPRFLNVYNEIYDGESLQWPETDYRKADKFRFHWRTKDCENTKITEETYIQRNIFLNDEYYKDELGHIFGYEVTFVGNKKRFAPVDLVGYKFENGKFCFYLTELKACPAENITPANDLLLRTIFEIVTYQAYFKKVLKKNDELAKAVANIVPDDQFVNALQKSLTREEKISIIKNADIKLVVLAPDYIINEKDDDYMKPFIKPNIKFCTIQPSKEYNATALVGTKGKLFDIIEN